MNQQHNSRKIPFYENPWSLLIAGFLVVAILWLQGCGGGGSGSDSSATSTAQGEVVIGLTDAAGDFLSYNVNVLSIKLEQADGTLVETLPLSTPVDFAQYTELTEFLTAATVPSGTYVQVNMVLDYGGAQVVVEDENGDPQDATVQDESGVPVTLLEVELQLSNDRPLVIKPGVPAYLTLDFDLAATNTVDLEPVPAVVTVEPALIADTILEDPKTHRLRGLLALVNETAGIFTVKIRPFHHLTGKFGTLDVHTSGETTYEIDGQEFTGADGLVQLATLPATAPVVTLVESDFEHREINALEVYAGSSVPWGDKDVVTGNVIAREGDAVTLQGATVVRSNNSGVFHEKVTVLLGDTTTVTRQGGDSDDLDKDDISVGQRLTVMGNLTNTIPGELELDATAGHARMLYTTLQATVVNAIPLTLNLQHIDRRGIGLFDFSGTGLSEDADPDNYEVDTGALGLENIAAGDPVKVRGFVTAFGAAPPDFEAVTVVEVSSVRARLHISWAGDGDTAPFTGISPEGFVVDLDPEDVGDAHHVIRAGVATDLFGLAFDPTLAPDNDGSGLFVINQNQSHQVFTDFTSFQEELANRLDGVTAMQRIHARGAFEDATAIMEGHRMSVRLQ